MIVLGIETSCDESSVALVKDGIDILGVKTFTQIKTHELFGGVVPEEASRIHVNVLHSLLNTLLNETSIDSKEIDLIAVTNCPGLMGALLVGVNFGNALAFAWDKPIVGINHLEGHIYAALMHNKGPIELPSLAVVVSGGHTQMVMMDEIGKYEIIGNTLDDAIGEAFDKTALLLGLGYPGGPKIDRLAKQGNSKKYKFPQGLKNQKETLNFSFSGLKTSVLYKLYGNPPQMNKALNLSDQEISDFCASFQSSATNTITNKLEMALDQHLIKSIILCGGVAANSELQQKTLNLAKKRTIKAHIPPLSLCTDNATMIAGLGYHKQHEAKEFVSDTFANKQISLEQPSQSFISAN